MKLQVKLTFELQDTVHLDIIDVIQEGAGVASAEAKI